jgi:hypothetical protein
MSHGAMRIVKDAAIAATLVVTAACAGCAGQQNPIASVQEAAQELNSEARFGRTEIAMDRVAVTARDEYAAHHRGWGSNVRIADLEVAGMNAHGDHDVDVLVRVSWYRPNEEDLRLTTLRQSWHDKAGWRLITEKRDDGDPGLLGEEVVFEAPADQRPPAQFPTVRLGAAGAP